MERRPVPNESSAYREARETLLAAEESLREQTERVAALRRSLPLGGEVGEDYEFEELDSGGGVGRVRLSELFAEGRDSLFLYGFMFGPKMDAACPMCTSFLDFLNGGAPHLAPRINIAVTARSPIERIAEYAQSRGWRNLRMLSSAKNNYPIDYLTEGDDESQWPMANVFVRRDGRIHHFWCSELFFRPAAGGHPRHVDAIWPLWNVLDLTPEGRGESWFPSLSYAE